MSFGKNKMAPLKALMTLMIVAHHLALFYGITVFKPFVKLGAPIVSVFFFISGFGLQKSYQMRGKDYLDGFWGRRIWIVVAPVFVSLCVYYVLTWNLSHDFWNEWKDLIINGKTILPFSWFAIEIVSFYCVYYLSYRFLHKRWKLIGVWVGVVILMVVFILVGYDRCWWVSSLAFPFGIVAAYNEGRVFSFYEKHPVFYWFTLLGLSLVFVLAYLSSQQYIWTICYVCIPLIVALVVARLPLEKLNVRVISFLAMISYEIYLCHGIVVELLRGRFFIKSDWLFVTLVYTVTILLAWGVHSLSALLIPTPCTSSTT